MNANTKMSVVRIEEIIVGCVVSVCVCGRKGEKENE